MKKPSLLSLLFITLLIAGCRGMGDSAPAASPTPKIIPTVTIEPTIALTPTPVPEVPPGWSAQSLESPAVSFYLPPGWEAVTRDALMVDLRETGGAGWVEIALVTAESAHLYGLDAANGLTAGAITDQLTPALGEDGIFSQWEAIWPYFAREVVVINGQETIYSESLFIAVVGREADALLMTGHQSDMAWDELVVIYRQIAASLG